MRANIVLIGPSGTGKSTLAQLLGEALKCQIIELDQVRWDYYNEIGYDADYAQKLREEHGMEALATYWKPFEIYSVERLFAERPSDLIISLGAGHSVYENADMLERAKKALDKHTVILLLPSANVERSLDVLSQRIWAKETFLTKEFIEHIREINRKFIEHPSNSELATMIVFTEDKQPQETCQEIIQRLNSLSEVS